jgi:hypothetical protein
MESSVQARVIEGPATGGVRRSGEGAGDAVDDQWSGRISRRRRA